MRSLRSFDILAPYKLAYYYFISVFYKQKCARNLTHTARCPHLHTHIVEINSPTKHRQQPVSGKMRRDGELNQLMPAGSKFTGGEIGSGVGVWRRPCCALRASFLHLSGRRGFTRRAAMIF